MLSVVMLNVVMLSVVAPSRPSLIFDRAAEAYKSGAHRWGRLLDSSTNALAYYSESEMRRYKVL